MSSSLTKVESLHYKVKALVFSAPVLVERALNANSELTGWSLSSEFKFPPGLGKKRSYHLWATYADQEQMLLRQAWDGKELEKRLHQIGRLDLGRFFWQKGYASQLTGGNHKVLWLKEGVEVVTEMDLPQFALRVTAKNSTVATVEGRFGPDGLLQSLKVTVPKLPQLKALSVERVESQGGVAGVLRGVKSSLPSNSPSSG